MHDRAVSSRASYTPCDVAGLRSGTVALRDLFDCALRKLVVETVELQRLRNELFNDEIHPPEELNGCVSIVVKLDFSRVDGVISKNAKAVESLLNLYGQTFRNESTDIVVDVPTALAEMNTELLENKPEKCTGTAR